MSSASAATLQTTVSRRRIHSGRHRVVVDVLHECRSEGLAPEADIEPLADRLIAMVDGVAMRSRQLSRPVRHLTLRHPEASLPGKPGT
ncbi:hypothetical protein ACUXZZ_01435 [Streptomyces graminifolii]|uniref:hypothetical protein n=1 Tax=Streptomyces graminifolii TaxID=1266771 RepID=UPI00405804DC